MITWNKKQSRSAAVRAQGLAGAIAPALGEIVERTGFVRTLGGIDAYLALRARSPEMSRSKLDTAVAAGDLRVSPSVRGCIYLVARRHAGVSLRTADLLSRRRNERDAERAGIRPGEIEEVEAAVLEALREHGPLSTHGLRKELPEEIVRSLGETGKKVGVSSTLPPALRRLEFAGVIERALEGGRLDSERYSWSLTETSPFEGQPDADELGELAPTLAEIFFGAAGAGTLEDFVAWSGLGRRDARAALQAAGLSPVEVEGCDRMHWVASERQAELQEDVETVALLPFEDNLPALHGGLASFVDPAHHDVEIPVWGRGRPTPLGEVRHSSFRSILLQGRIEGFWEFDPARDEVTYGCFRDPGSRARAQIGARAEQVGTFIREQLGNARSFSTDTEKAMCKRCEQIRQIAANR